MNKIIISYEVNQKGRLVSIFKSLKTNRLDKKTKLFSDYDYIDHLITKHIESEDYEKCEKLCKLKKTIKNSKIKRHRAL